MNVATIAIQTPYAPTTRFTIQHTPFSTIGPLGKTFFGRRSVSENPLRRLP